MYYFNARWYDASTGRFISEDPARDGLNWYVYVSNNPLNKIDPTGLETLGLKIGMNAGFVFGLSGDLKIAIDNKLNIALVATIGGGATTPDASLMIGASYANVDTVFDEAGEGGSLSVSASIPGAVASVETSLYPSGRTGTSINIGSGLGPVVGGSSMATQTAVLGLSLETAFNDIENLSRNVMDIIAGIKTPDQIFDGVVNPVTLRSWESDEEISSQEPTSKKPKPKPKKEPDDRKEQTPDTGEVEEPEDDEEETDSMDFY